jgi:hypothetical protein
MTYERCGVQVGYDHVTMIEEQGCIAVLCATSGNSTKVRISAEDARHLATQLRRIARRVEKQGLK